MTSQIDKHLSNCKSWEDFEQLVASLKTTKEKGDYFERLTQLYLLTTSTYQSKVKHVWWCNNPYNEELPDDIRIKLNLPEGDEGIDLICETFDQKYWSVQAKYRTDADKALTTSELSKFLNLSFVTSNSIELGLITHTSTRPVKKQELMGNTTEIGLENFLDISQSQWETINELCRGEELLTPKTTPHRDYQDKAIEKAVEHFVSEGEPRGKLIMPCGTGKSLTAFWIAQALEAKTIILAVPSLYLVRQSLADWTREFLAEGITPEWLAVCSDDSVGNMRDADSAVSTVYETGIPTTTNSEEIIEFLKKDTDQPKIIFTTYQSGQTLADASNEAGFEFDLLIADEAHKTVGSKEKMFATLLLDKNIQIKNRLFMTATERVFRGSGDEIVSMDDPDIYGTTFYQMTFKQAIDAEVICDYKIITLLASEADIEQIINERSDVVAQQGNKKVETAAESLSAGIVIEKAFEDHKINKAITFHRTIQRAKDFSEQQEIFSNNDDSDVSNIQYLHLSKKQTTGQRKRLLKQFEKHERAVISNARILTEGVNIPAIDCVAFIDPKNSVIDIVQGAGRAMRVSKETGKEFGYILVPVVVPDGADLEEFAGGTDFKAVSKVIAALSTQDERIVEELRAKADGSGGSRIVNIHPVIRESIHVDYKKLQDTVSSEIWKVVGRANFLSYEEAKKRVRSEGIQTKEEYIEWAKSKLKPHNIPASPDTKYKGIGWNNWGDWLGTGNVWKKEFLPFKEARDFARSLKISSSIKWYEFSKAGNLKKDIPAAPSKVYPEWNGWRDWLGTGSDGLQKTVQANDALPFEEAREFAHSLKLNSYKEWYEFCKSGRLPADIPKYPHYTYEQKGWDGIDDWLGKTRKFPYLKFNEAKKIVHKLELNSQNKYTEWSKSGERPSNIPSSPQSVYKKEWLGWPDWLGKNERKAAGTYSTGTFLEFQEAREFVHSLNLKGSTEWIAWAKTKNRPANIPSRPDREYKNKGWVNTDDWLGLDRSNDWEREKDPEADD